MSPRLVLRASAACLTAALALPALAHADGPPPNCRASVARVTGGPAEQLTSEPVRSNDAGTPCSAQSSEGVKPDDIGPLHLDAASAVTDLAKGAMGGRARATTASVELPGLSIRTGVLSATALGRCVDGATALEGSSSVLGLVVNGQAIDIPADGMPFTLDLSPVATVRANVSATQDGVLTRRAVEVDAGGVTVVLGEAVAGGDACAAGAPSAEDAVHGICPEGSTYDARRGECLIAARSEANRTSESVSVARGFQGPSGGSVMELTTARSHLGAAGGCLAGKGPDFAVLGTAGSDSVTGSDAADRLVMKDGNDTVSGGRGDDCIYGGSGRDVLTGALGRDRVVGGSGNDALDGGGGADRLSGGDGRDTVNAGYGQDTVSGGAGNDAINVAVAGPPARSIDCGKGRDKVRINRNERRRVHGCETVYRIR